MTTSIDQSLPVNSAEYNSLPQYYTDTAQDFSGYIQDYLQRINEPGGYSSGYSGPRIAGTDQLQQSSYDAVSGAAGFQTPYFNQGAETMRQGQGWLSQAHDYTSQKPAGSFDNAGNMLNEQYNQLGNVDPYFGSGNGALTQASQQINNSSTYNPAQMQQHLSPYMSGVNDEISRLGNERLNESILPQINSTFTGSGQFGSTRNADFSNRAIRDSQREVLGAQVTAMNQAYGQASNDYLGWAKQGQGAGGALTNVGQAYGNLGSNALNRYTTGANIGTSLGNLGGQQASYGNILGGQGNNAAVLGREYGNYGVQGANQNWQDITQTNALGTERQGYNQRILDNAYNDWQSRWTQPAALAGGLAQMIPNYTGKVTPDKAGYSTTPASQSNYLADFGSFIQASGG